MKPITLPQPPAFGIEDALKTLLQDKPGPVIGYRGNQGIYLFTNLSNRKVGFINLMVPTGYPSFVWNEDRGFDSIRTASEKGHPVALYDSLEELLGLSDKDARIAELESELKAVRTELVSKTTQYGASVEPTLPPVPEGFVLFGKGPLKQREKLYRGKDVAALSDGKWNVGGWAGMGDTYYYALRIGSPIAIANGFPAPAESEAQPSAPVGEVPPAPLRIKAGKKYVRRDGKVTGPIEENKGLSCTFPWRDPLGCHTYTNAGTALTRNTKTVVDLISLYDEGLPLPADLPQPPEEPGYRWVYRGIGWSSEGRVTKYSILSDYMQPKKWSNTDHGSCNNLGNWHAVEYLPLPTGKDGQP